MYMGSIRSSALRCSGLSTQRTKSLQSSKTQITGDWQYLRNSECPAANGCERQSEVAKLPPQILPQYSEGYYAVFFVGPDGIKRELPPCWSSWEAELGQ